MSCRLCQKLKLKKLKRLNKSIEKGNLSVEKLADKYDLPPKAILRHYNNCLGGAPKVQPKSGVETLQTILDTLLEDLKSARNDYLYGNEEQASGAANFYKELVKEVREYAASIERMRPNEDLVNAVHGQVIKPLLSEMAKILIEEGGNFDHELRDLLQNRYDTKTQKLVKDTWKKISTRFFVLEAGEEKLMPKLTSVIAEQNSAKKVNPKKKPKTVSKKKRDTSLPTLH